MSDKVREAILKRLKENDGVASFKLKISGNVVRVTEKSYGRYFVEVNEKTIHRNADLNTIIKMMI